MRQNCWMRDLPSSEACQVVGLVLVDDGHGVSADYLLEGLADGVEQRAAVLHLDELDELHEHFGVGLGVEVYAMLLECVLEDLEVLYGAVVDECQVAVLAVVGVGVVVGGFAVGSPASVGDSESGLRVLVAAEVLKRGHLAARLVHIYLVIGSEQRYAGAVVAPVFEALKALDEHVVDVAVANISYYSAHIIISCGGFTKDPLPEQKPVYLSLDPQS